MNYSIAQYEYAKYTAQYGLAYSILSAIAMVGALIQAARKKTRWINPYATVFIAALCYVISGALTANLPKLHFYNQLQLVSDSASILFFANVFAPIAWLVIFATYHITTTSATRRLTKETIGIYFGYLWFLILIISDIGLAGTISKKSNGLLSHDAALNIYNTMGLVRYGLWVFFVPFIVQTYISWKDIFHFRVPFLGYVFLLMLVNIGSSIENSNVAVISFATFGILHATFALARLCGILALFVAIIFGHQWQPKPENGATGNDIESPHENPDEKIYEEPEDKTRSINSAAGLAASGVTGPPPAIVAGTDHAHTNPAIPVTQ